MATDLTGKTALVTGAASGFGRAIALAYLKAGGRVGLADLSVQSLERVAQEAEKYGDHAVVLPADLADPDDLRRLHDDVREKLGSPDILVNNAGIGAGLIRRDFVRNPVRFWEWDEEHLQQIFQVNALSPTMLAIWFAKDMVTRGWGRVVNVTTSLDTMLRPGQTGYGGSKAALEAHAAIMALELVGTGVTVNVLVPGGPANTPIVPEESGFDRAALIQPDAMAPPALWLASAASDGVTGRRFLAVHWDAGTADEVAAERAGGPIAWSGLSVQSVFPEASGQGTRIV